MEIELFTVPEVAKKLRVHPKTVLRLIEFRNLPAFKVGGQWRVRSEKLAEWVRGCEGQNGKP